MEACLGGKEDLEKNDGRKCTPTMLPVSGQDAEWNSTLV